MTPDFELTPKKFFTSCRECERTVYGTVLDPLCIRCKLTKQP